MLRPIIGQYNALADVLGPNRYGFLRQPILHIPAALSFYFQLFCIQAYQFLYFKKLQSLTKLRLCSVGGCYNFSNYKRVVVEMVGITDALPDDMACALRRPD